MAKGIFITKPDPEYDDLPEIRYHFPSRYLRLAEECVGDWILYYEPRRNQGRQAYFATARVRKIESDPVTPKHYYALVEDYLPFPDSVPFREGDFFYESALRRPDGSVNLGLFQWAIHHLPENEYELILQTGLAVGAEYQDVPVDAVSEDLPRYPERPLIEQVSLRPYRDRAFSTIIRSVYNHTCALTGFRLINGHGRGEVEAAHIRSVESNGPDSPRNGIALSRTVHWLFDRGIVSMEDDGRILKVDTLIPDQVSKILCPEGYARLPQSRSTKPHPEFLRWHREHVFKG